MAVPPEPGVQVSHGRRSSAAQQRTARQSCSCVPVQPNLGRRSTSLSNTTLQHEAEDGGVNFGLCTATYTLLVLWDLPRLGRSGGRYSLERMAQNHKMASKFQRRLSSVSWN